MQPLREEELIINNNRARLPSAATKHSHIVKKIKKKQVINNKKKAKWDSNKINIDFRPCNMEATKQKQPRTASPQPAARVEERPGQSQQQQEDHKREEEEGVRKCALCSTTHTLQWRSGPDGKPK